MTQGARRIYYTVGSAPSAPRWRKWATMPRPVVWKPKKAPKYNAKKTHRDGWNFDSQKEANYYDELKLAEKAGHVLFFLRQVPFHLEGGTIYRADFQVWYTDGTVRHIDVKGFATEEYKRKKRKVAAQYGVEIEEV